MIVTLLPSTGFDPTEAAVPWRALTEAGFEGRFATPDGRMAPQTVQDEVVSVLDDESDFDAGTLLARRDSARHPDRGFTVRDGNYLLARWPGDVHTFAHQLVRIVEGHWFGLVTGGP